EVFRQHWIALVRHGRGALLALREKLLRLQHLGALQVVVAIEWTRDRLSAPQRRFLAELPLLLQEEDRLYVHSEASAPSHWNYVQSATDAARSLIATPAHVTFCGHIHRPALYSMSTTAKMTSFVPTSGVPIQLLRGRRSVSRAMAI